MKRHAALPWFTCLALVLVSSAQTPEGPKPGELGYQPPEVRDVRVPDAVMHHDTTGGSLQTLLALGGATGGGFGAVWRDTRDGTLGLYFARLDAEGKPRESERSICSPHTMRRTDAVVALAPDAHGTIAWTAVLGHGAVPFVRTFDAAGELLSGERIVSPIVEFPSAEAVRGGRGDDAASCREPALATLAGGRTVIVWTRGGRMQWLELARDGEPEGPIADLDPALPPAESGVRLAVGAEGVVACLWRTKEGAAQVTVRRGKRAVTNEIGRGIPRAISADPSGGYWTLLVDEGRSRVQHLGADGTPDRAASEIADGRDPKAELVTFEGGVALLERPTNAAEANGIPRVWLLDASGANKPGSPFAIPSSAARGVSDPKIASAGTKLLVAWTDGREGDANIYARLVDVSADPEKRLGDEFRLNTDTASANQGQTAIASSGDHGASVWLDDRGSPSRAYLRRFGVNGFAGNEIALPVAVEGAAPLPNAGTHHPAVAVAKNGDALVCWRSAGERNQSRIVAQIIALDGRALTPLLEIDPGTPEQPLEAACIALSKERGFAIAWPRAGAGSIHIRLVSPKGTLGETRTLSESRPPGAEAQRCVDVALTELESGRVLCAWTQYPPAKACSIRGRFLTETLTPIGAELTFDGTERNGDWDPALAPSMGGGFVMSWTSGPLEDPVRDVVVRAFDGRAKPIAPYHHVCFPANEQDFSDVARLADGSFVIAWEDDVSYYDQVYVRRLMRDGKTLGPMMRINMLETKFLIDRVSPRLAPMGGGFGAVFADRHRSRGFDAMFKLVGPNFDSAEQR